MKNMKKVLAIFLVITIVMSCVVIDTATMQVKVQASDLQESVGYGEFNGNTYQIFDISLTWNEAKAYCEDFGGHLVTITSAEEQAFIATLVNKGEKNQYWIGLTTTEEPQWITGEEYSYSNWDAFEPNNSTREDGESEDYVHINNMPNPYNWGSQKYKWNDMYYDNIFPGEESHFSTNTVGFICEWETSDDDNLNTEFNGNTYELFDISLTWQDAKKYCEDIGGHLVTITSAEEQAYVETLLSNGEKSQYWIGLTTAEEPQWITGEAFSYSNWDRYEPDNSTREDGENEDYVHILNVPNPQIPGSEKYKWNDMYYDNTYSGEENYFSKNKVGFICEWEGAVQSSEYASLMGDSWKKAGMENIYEYLMTFPSISKAVIDSYNSDQTFIDSVAGWKFMEYMFEPGNTVNDALNMKDYYTAILLSLIDAEIMDENYIKSIEESSKFEYTKLYGEISNIIKSCGELDHEKLLSEGTCSIEDISILNDKINSLDSASTKISNIGSFLSTGKTINDSINLCINYYNICNTSQYIINVLRQMQANTSNMFLSMAIDDIVSVSDNSFDYVTSGFLAGSANVAKDYGVGKINDAWESVLNSTTLTKGALLGYKIGKPLSNIFLSTDSIISNYFEFMALYEVEKALKSTISDFEANFYNKVDADASLNYINAVALYFKSYYLSYDYAVDLAKYSKLCPFAYIFYNGKQSFEDANKQFNATRSSMKTYEDQLFREWSYSLKERYPEIYSEIAPSVGNLYSTDLSTALVRLEYLSKTYTGQELRPSVTVSMGNAVLLPEDYTVTYYNNIEPGLATVKIEASEGSIYTGEKTIEFTIKELPFVKRWSIRGTISQTTMFNLCNTEDDQVNSSIVLPDVYFYEGDEIVASVENGTITNDELPIFVTENGIDVLVHDKNYIVEISGSSEQTYNTEIQKLDEELSPIETSNYNNLSLANGILCNIHSNTEDEVVVNNEILQADFSTNEITTKQQYNIYSEQCVVNDFAYETQRVYISAIIPEGNIFVGWFISPQVLLSSNEAVSSFIMPSEDVYISAGFVVNQAYFDLKDAISEASAIERKKYTKSSYESLQTIIEECKSVLTNDISEELSQEKIALIQTSINALEEIAPLSFTGASLTLQDDLVINFKANETLFTEEGYTNPYVIFSLNGVETKVTKYTVENGKYVFDFTDIAPHMINDTVYATLYATYNGVEYASAVREYSVATYCYNMLGKYTTEEYAELQTLLVDLLNYGSKTQEYLGYNTDTLANAQLTEEQAAWGTSTERTFATLQDTKYEAIENPSVLWKGAGLTLQDSITMRFKIAAESIKGLSVKVTCAGGEWTILSSEFELIETGSYYVYFDALSAAQMSEPVYLTVYNGDTAVSHTIRYSVESYAYAKQNDADANLVALVRAMMKYGDSAYAYVN